jgi:hypothetical protein
MQLKLKPVRVITGALAVKVKINHFAMARIKVQNLLQLNIKQLRVKPYIFADVNKVQINHYVMEHTVVYKQLKAKR